MNIFELFGTIAINNEQANKALSDTGKQANGLSSTMEAAFSRMQSAAKKIGTAVATAFAVDKIKDFGQSCALVFANVAAEESAFAQIMGEYAGRATDKMNLVAEQTGVVATRLTPYMTSMTAKFKGLGYDVEEATNLAAEGLIIASDASAFWDKSLDESMSHLNSFINGSYEGGEAIGLFANDTQMAAYAVEQGIVKEKKAWSELDEARKQSLRLQYAKEMMVDSGATGQAALEAENYANVQANLNEQIEQFQAVIGEPIMNNIMLPAMRRVSQYMPQITEKAATFIKTYSEGFRRFTANFSSIFTEDGIDLSKLPGALSSAIASIWPDIQEKCLLQFGIDLPKWVDIESKITTWWTDTKTAVQNVCTWMMKLPENPSEAPEEIASAVKVWWDGTALPAIKSVSGWALQLFGHPVENDATIEEHVKKWWETAGGIVADACSWTLKLFDMPEESAEAIGAKVKTWWNSILGAVDKETWSAFFADFSDEARDGLEDANSIFGLALDAISGLAMIGTEAVTGALTWILENGKATADILETIAVGFAVGAIAAHPYAAAIMAVATTLGLMAERNADGDPYNHWFDKYTNEDLATLQKWVEAVREAQAAEAAMNDALDRGEDGQKEGAALLEAQKRRDALFKEANAIEGLIGTYEAWRTGQAENTGKNLYLDVPARIAEDSEATMQSEVDGMNLETDVHMDADTSGLQADLDRTPLHKNVEIRQGYAGGAVRTAMPLSKGLDFVPRDGYLARLHYGEAVLNRTTADILRSGGGMGDISRLEALFNQMLALMQQFVANSGGGHQIVLDSGVLVGQLTPAIDTQLGTIGTRKGRRN